MSHRRVLDVSPLPTGAFGHQGLIWWGTVGFMVIEGSMFVLVLIAYFYFRIQVSDWPPSLPDPSPGFGTANLLLVIVSCIPAALAKMAAEKHDLSRVKVWLSVLTGLGVVALVLRAFEFPALNCRWDDNAYGSIVWMLLGLHTTHVATDVVDSAVLLALTFRAPVSQQRYVDISENSLYWYFIVLWWFPIYLTIYFAPRWL
jgi:heme/copper-type cytochrome/quinol oxidase subunit 3